MFGQAFRNGPLASRKFLRILMAKNYNQCSCQLSQYANVSINECARPSVESKSYARFTASSIALTRARRLHTSARLHGELVTGKAPAFAESVTEGDIRWEKAVGDSVEEDELVAEIETDKTSIQVHAPCSGVIKELLIDDGEKVVAHQELFRLEMGASGSSDSSKKESSAEKEKEDSEQDKQKDEADSSKDKQQEQEQEQEKKPKKDDDKKKSSGDKEDKLVSSQSPTKPQPLSQSGSQQQQQQQKQQQGDGQRERRVKMSRMRQRIAQRLKEAQNTCAMLTTFNEIDMSGVFELRQRYQQQFEKQHGVKLGFMSPFVKAAAYALQQQAAVNAYIDGNDIVYRDYVDISIAVATPKGLVVPVLRGIETMDLADIEKGIAGLGQKARNNELAIEDMDGGTFTISNGGVFGSLFGTPIINPPQSAILGMHGVFERPVAVKGEVQIRPMMYVALTYDHRLIDGREAVTFLRKIKSFVEDPRVLLLGL